MKIMAIATVVLLSGCSSQPLFYNEFSPPKNSKQVYIKIDSPTSTDVLPLNVMYRSYKCKVSRRVSEREYRDVPGFHNMEVLLNQQGNTTVFAKEIPISGGGRCDWRLSNIMMGLRLNKNHKHSYNIKKFIGSNIILIFDTNLPKTTGGKKYKIDGDLTISKDYFNWIDKGIKGHEPTLRLFGGESYVYYDISNPNVIFWEPKINDDPYIITEYPKSKITTGVKTLIKYSNGDISQGDTDDEMYKKLLSMMEK